MRIGRDVIPSNLSVAETPTFSNGQVFDNVRLRMGEVRAIIYPDDQASLSKKFVEYSVFVQHRSGNGAAVGKMYYHCVIMNPLAGLADQVQWTLRDDPGDKKSTNGLGKGSKVLVLCINGETTNAVILGGLRDSSDEGGFGGTNPKSLGHYYHWVFNGASVDVNDDGELVLKYGGKTKIDGTTDVSKNVAGAKILMDKDGGVLIVDGAGTTGIYVDHKHGKIIVQRDKAMEIGDATDFMLLGQSFRQAQQKMNNQLLAQFKTLQTLLQTAGAAITTASGVPSVPGVAPAGFAPAGAALVAAAQLAGQMGQALQDFEQSAAQKNSYLSKLNKND